MIALKIGGVLLLLILAALLIPVTYSLRFEKWQLDFRISWLAGLLQRKKQVAIHSPGKEEPEIEDTVEAGPEDEKEKEEWEFPGPAVADEGKIDNAPENREEIPPAEEPRPEDMEETGDKTEKEGPSLLSQIHFGLENGLAEALAAAISRLLSHSFPVYWHVEGALGLGDPMDTGILCGMIYASLPGAAQAIDWDYTEKVCTLKGESRGRLIPLYVLYILIRLAVSRPAREFWHFRQGGNDNG